MLRVPIHKIQSGMVLARPVPLPSNARRYLLQRDREIPVDIVPRLEQLGVLEVWIHYPNLEFLDGLIDEGLGDRQREVYWHVRRNFESIMNGTTVELDIRHFQSAVSELFSFIKSTARSGLLLQKLDRGHVLQRAQDGPLSRQVGLFRGQGREVGGCLGCL